MSNEHVNPLILESLGIFERLGPMPSLPQTPRKKMHAINHVARLFVRSGKLAITHGIPNHMVCHAKPGECISGTQRLRDIRKRFYLMHPGVMYDPLEYNPKTKCYHAHDMAVLDWLERTYLKS